MMLKVLVIQTANNLSDERTEFLINDRLSFMRFLGLSDRNYPPPISRLAVQVDTVWRIVLKALVPGLRRAVSMTVRMSASPCAAHMAR